MNFLWLILVKTKLSPVSVSSVSGNNYSRETGCLCVIIANSRVKVPANGGMAELVDAKVEYLIDRLSVVEVLKNRQQSGVKYINTCIGGENPLIVKTKKLLSCRFKSCYHHNPL